jgi:hypothetical protein
MGALNHQQMFNRGCRTTTTRENTLKHSALCTDEEGINEFNARIEREDQEAMAVACPLVESCGAQVGEPCCTDSGQKRIRHCRRLLEARKLNG